MKTINLMENTIGDNKECLAERGLSFYIESGKHRILMDTGATGTFCREKSMFAAGAFCREGLVFGTEERNG